MTDQHEDRPDTPGPTVGPAAGAGPGTAAAGATLVAGAEYGDSERILTIPNLISFARLLGVPVFLWLVLVVRSKTGDWWALGLLAASGLSDWLDGKIARALHQQTRLGQLLDPAADRLYIVATVIALAVRSIIPWWLVAVLAVRELVMAVVLAVLRRRGWSSLQVSFAGKTATLCLLYAFPLLFLGSHAASYAEVTRIIGWSFAIWGSALYWWAAGLYIAQARQLLAESQAGHCMAARPEGGAGPVTGRRETRP
ncbi:MAG TPA: CDP-alcohol phosphatidyltransferase family protein [Streptosporangiaceae bacterium]|nr:CDP-alcohol phosphatidyltransferase family protein [Streptosporangiaceae bacterium]